MEIKREKLRGVRKTIGFKLLNSLNSIPHATIMTTVDMTEIVRIRNDYKSKGRSVATTAFLIKAIAIVLERYPQLNTRLENGEIVYYDNADAGIAVDTPRGLMVITVRDVTHKDIWQITDEMRDIVARLKVGKATMEETSGSTFSVSNEAMSTNDYFNSIINNDECFIIGLPRYKKQLIVNDDDSISIRYMGNIMANYNHMLADGMPVAAFLGEISRLLSDPIGNLIQDDGTVHKEMPQRFSIQSFCK